MDQLWNNAPCAVVLFNDEGEILDCNGTLLKWLGMAPPQRPKKFSDLLTVAGKVFYQTHLFPLLKLEGRAEEIFLQLRAESGEPIPLLCYAVRRDEVTQCVLVPIRERRKYELEILAAKKDAEEAVRSNDELIAAKHLLEERTRELERRIRESEQRNRELLQVSKILFHDVREPIRKIETFSGLLQSEQCSSTDQERAVVAIQTACDRMQQLLLVMQDFVSVETAQEPVTTVDLNLVVRAAYSQVSREFEGVDAELTAEPLPSIEGYSRQLHLLFVNLFEDSFRSRRPDVGLKLTVVGTVVEENRYHALPGHYGYISYAQIMVSDNGKTIPEEQQSTMFELLKKVGPGEVTPGGGLAICKKVVENHYGTIAVSPLGQQGTTFKVLLPIRFESSSKHE